jgi:hypothetical protein
MGRRTDIVSSRWLVVVTTTLAAACSTGDESAGAPGPGSLVVGITSDVGVIEAMTRLDLVLEAPPGQVLSREELQAGDGALFPFERMFPVVEAGTRLAVTLTPVGADGTALFSRHVETSALADRTLLLRVRLNAECIPDDEWPRATSCAPPWSCVAGLCEDPYVSPSRLGDYAPDWGAPVADPCVTPHDEPTIEIGRAAPPFAPLEPGTVLVPEYGEQGGTHVWFSVRMRNLSRDGTVVALTADILDTGVLGSVQKSAGPFEDGPTGCDQYQLRYILPQNGAWEQDVRLGVTLTDGLGTCARENVDVYVASPAQ